MSSLTGKYYWVNDSKIHPEEEHGYGRIENVVIDDNMIQFFIKTPGEDDETVSLTWHNIKRKYINITGDIDGQLYLYENKKFICGTWLENQIRYTWWAVTD